MVALSHSAASDDAGYISLVNHPIHTRQMRRIGLFGVTFIVDIPSLILSWLRTGIAFGSSRRSGAVARPSAAHRAGAPEVLALLPAWRPAMKQRHANCQAC